MTKTPVHIYEKGHSQAEDKHLDACCSKADQNTTEYSSRTRYHQSRQKKPSEPEGRYRTVRRSFGLIASGIAQSCDGAKTWFDAATPHYTVVS